MRQWEAYRRGRRGSVVDAVESRVRELLQACPTMPATVIAERIGWPYSIRTLSTRVAELRPIYLPPDPTSRTSYLVGEIAQCDFWFPPIRLPVGFGQTRTASQLPVLTMITGYARWALGVLVPTRRAEDLYAAGGGCLSSWVRCHGCWCGMARPQSAAGGLGSRS
jgi:transposase